MPTIDVDASTATAIQLAANLAGVTPGEVVRRLVERAQPMPSVTPERSPGEAVTVHAVYEGRRTEAVYDPATHRVTIMDGPLSSRSFKSPSGAAIAVVSHYQPGVNPNRNGWTFWTVTASGELLQSLRHSR